MSVVSVRGLAKAYGRRVVLDGVSFDLDRGCLVGIQGENGAGKSTLLRCLVGLDAPDAGRIELSGRLGYCPQDADLPPALTGREVLHLFAAGYRLPPAQTAARTSMLAGWFRCGEQLDQRIDRLSGGTRQKVNLIAALLHDPDLLVLDEPYQGFDHETYLIFWEYAERLRHNGATALVVSHLHAEPDRFDAVLTLRAGRIDGEVASQVGRQGSQVVEKARGHR